MEQKKRDAACSVPISSSQAHTEAVPHSERSGRLKESGYPAQRKGRASVKLETTWGRMHPWDGVSDTGQNGYVATFLFLTYSKEGTFIREMM